MRLIRRGLAWFAGLALCLSLVLVALPTQAADSEPADSEPAETAEARIELGDALVSVNGSLIERARFDSAFARLAAFSNAADPNTLALDVLNSLIEDELILQFARENDLEADEEAIEGEIKRLEESTGADGWEAWLVHNQYTADEFRDELRQHLVTMAVREQVTAHFYGDVPHVRARHILVARESETRSVMRRLRAGESFAALAAAHSLDVSTREFGGDLGWFVRGELLDRRLGEVAFSQEFGEISGPIATRLGYHVLQVIGRAERGIEPGRLPHLIENSFNLWLEAQLENANIRFNLGAIDKLPGARP